VYINLRVINIRPTYKMLFTSAALAILAHSAAVLAAPAGTPSSTTSAAAAASTGLSLTAQLTLADTAVDRFNLLKENKDFVFDFNVPQANPGKGGELIAANRKTFPALVGTGAGMAVGRVKRKHLSQHPPHDKKSTLT
jgi:hypothetical protein